MSVENSLTPSVIPAADNDQAFVDRRNPTIQRNSPGLERRQFSDGHGNLSQDAAELGRAIDQYKLEKCRRYISYEEMLGIIMELGYEKKQ